MSSPDENTHKDFHGALSYGIEFLEKTFGFEGVAEFFSGLSQSVYKGLVADLAVRGVPALEDHWRRIFDLEGGEYEMVVEGETLVLTVRRCPAIHHMKEHNYSVARHFCEHTRIVNEAVCRAAGFECAVEYDQERGRCTQRFWRRPA